MLRLHAPRYDSLRRAFTVWTTRVAQRAGIIGEDEALSNLQEVRTMLMERAAQWKGEYIQQGVIMGRREGRREGISIGRTEGISIGRQEGIAIGQSRGRRESAQFVLRDLLEARFDTLPEHVASAVAGIDDVRKLHELTRSVLWVASLDMFMEELKKIC